MSIYSGTCVSSKPTDEEPKHVELGCILAGCKAHCENCPEYLRFKSALVENGKPKKKKYLFFVIFTYFTSRKPD
jgi:hypothetical protein